MTANWIDRLKQDEEGRRLLEQERLIVEVTEAMASLLKEREVSRSELARRIGTSPAFVTKLLRGDNNFTLRTLSDVFFALGHSAHFSLGDVGEDVTVCPTRVATPLRLNKSTWQQSRGEWPSRKAPTIQRFARDEEDIAA